MKNLLIAILLLTVLPALAQGRAGTDTLAIRTNAVCDMCVKTIETELVYEKGVSAVKVDLEHSLIRVAINEKKTDVEKVRKAITELGYAADDLLPDMAAREKLPDCCKKEGCGLPVAPAPIERKN